MTRKEIIEFLNFEYDCKKSDMKTIKGMIQEADRYGYNIIKNGVDDFDLREKGVVIDFTKPLKINRSVPELASNKMYNGVPVSMLSTLELTMNFNSELWCYLMNKNDNDVIHFNEILQLKTKWCHDFDEIVRNFDSLAFLGFIREKEDYIECYAYPLRDNIQGPYNYITNKNNTRFAPFNYVA